MRELLLGLDVGTTATKAILFDLDGQVVASASTSYGLITPAPDWVEQDPAEFWRAVVTTCQQLVSVLKSGDRILALCQSSQAGTTIPVDACGEPLYNAFSWLDARGKDHEALVRQKLGDDYIRTTTGWTLRDVFSLQHIGWLRLNRPDLFASVRYFMFVNDFIGFRLTGERCMNPSDAGVTQIFNIAENDWDQNILNLLAVRKEQLSPLFPSGHLVGKITGTAAEQTGLPEGLPVFNGAHDQYSTAIGVGVTSPGKVSLSCGTAWVLLAVPPSREAGLQTSMAIGRHAVPGQWGGIQSLGGVGASFEWLLNQVWGGSEMGRERSGLYPALNYAASQSGVGANGLQCVPVSGSSTSLTHPAGGSFLGLSLPHTLADMTRAAMEGIAFELRLAVNALRIAGVAVNELTMVGGAARSAVWTQIVCDVIAVPVIVPQVSDAAARGAAILAGVGAGAFGSISEGIAAFKVEENRLLPDAEHCRRYDDLFETYRQSAGLLDALLPKP